LAGNTPESVAPRVYATILYWRERELPLVERCVKSLLAQDSPAAALRVLVIDNGCGLSPRLPEHVELLHLPSNLGFTGGHNTGMRAALAAGADFCFLVNSDVVLDTACLRLMLEAASARPTVGIWGPLVLSERRAGQVESNGQAFNVWTGRHREISRGMGAADVDRTPHGVDAVSGCALLARRTVLERVGLLDDELFAYFEDVDWCLRARRAGFKVGVVPKARVWHQGAGSTTHGWPGTTFYSVRNHLVVTARYARRPLTWVLLPLVLAYHLAFLLRSRDLRTVTHLTALVRGTFAAWTAQMGQQAGLASSH
jgi:GT2 family glycosyltransferase